MHGGPPESSDPRSPTAEVGARYTALAVFVLLAASSPGERTALEAGRYAEAGRLLVAYDESLAITDRFQSRGTLSDACAG